ncbi:MAG: radical SAM protein [Bacteroidales bacterium]|nr:radical SAM protein [Bacteroidales bacterium]
MIAFGPIPSRRLGMSLGINNIVSHKICSYSCVYCQIGKTTRKSIVRSMCYEPENLVNEVEAHLKKLDKKHLPDYLTFVANGEPTLDINLGKEIKMLKKTGFPVAVITNASFIDKQQVREDLMRADWVSVKVDSVNEKIWNKINRPMTGIYLDKILEGLRIFVSEYEGKLHTETMLIDGYNDATEDLKENSGFIAGLHPETSYLSIPTRPPAEKEAGVVSEMKLTEAWQIFQGNGIKTELLTGFEGTEAGFTGNAVNDILNITAVHPLREDTIMELIKKEKANMNIVMSLVRQKLIREVHYKGKRYYVRSFHL